MFKYLLAAASVVAISTPAVARDRSPYIGIEGGVLFPKDQNIDGSIDFTDPTVPDVVSGHVADVDFKTGYDIDAIAGYDFGMFRLEGELGYKRAKADNLEFSTSFLNAINTAAGTTYTNEDFDLGGRASVLSGMVNGLVDFGDDNGVNFSVGAGAGRAKVKEFGQSDSAWAYQLLAAARMPISSNVDVGVKYRYFRTGKLNYDDTFAFTAAGSGITGGTAFLAADNKFSSHSLLASLIYNLGAPAAVAVEAPPPPPPPPAPVAPATQTCPDGSVILTTDVCAAPPPPPPPPPAMSGERGQ